MNVWENKFADAIKLECGLDLAAIDAVIRAARKANIEPLEPAINARRYALTLFMRGFNDDAMLAARAMFEAANGLHNALEVLPSVKRDAKRQAGTRKPRRQDLQAWINKEVAKGGETAKELRQRAPQWVKDEVEIDRFVKRVTAARKLVASK